MENIFRPIPQAAAAAYATAAIDALGTRVVAICAIGSTEAVAATLRALRPAASLLTGDVDAVDPAASSLQISDATGAVGTPSFVHRLLFERSFGTYLFYNAPAAATPLQIQVNVPVEGSPMIFDLTTGAGQRAAGYHREGATVRIEAPRTGRPMLIDFNADATGEALASRAEVSATRQMRVEEIIARHRQQQAAQDAAVDHYVAHARMEQHFRPTLTDPGYDVVTENRYFSSTDGVEWEELSFSVNGSRFGPRPAAVSAAAAREGPVAAAPAAVQRRLSLPVDRHGEGRRFRLLRRQVRPRRSGAIALSRHRLDRSTQLCACARLGRPDALVGARDLESGRAALRLGDVDRRTSGVSVVDAVGQADRA